MTQLLSLPAQLQRTLGVYWNPSAAFCDELARYLTGRRVLEIFAGNGLLAACLAARGVNVVATTRFSGHDAHERGLYYQVQECSAVSAVLEHGANADVLLVCWPTVTPAVLQAALRWGPERDIVFIGEVTDYTQGHLGGCATDEFFEAIDERHRFATYAPRNIMERAMVCRLLG